MKNVFAVFILLLSHLATAQDIKWYWQNPLPQGNSLQSVFSVNDSIAVAVGMFGTIVRTANGGKTWQNINMGLDTNFTSVFFTDSLTGWAVGATQKGSFDYGFGCIIHTTDGGKTWKNKILPSPGTFSGFTSVYFINQTTGWITGTDGSILFTSDGGENWQGRGVLGVTNLLLSAVSFASPSVGWVVGKSGGVMPGGVIFKTTNGGASWLPQTSSTNYQIRSVFAVDTLEAWATGDGGTLLHTLDGGTTWVSIPTRTTNGLLAIAHHHQTLWAVGHNGTFIKKEAVSDTVQEVVTDHYGHFHSIHFGSGQTGWAVGQFGVLLKTTNGGTTWQKQFGGVIPSFASVYFADSLNGWAVGSGGTIVNTQNGGRRWTNQVSNVIYPLLSVRFINKETGWAVGNRGTILKTTDGGKNWKKQTSPTTEILRGVDAVNENQVCAVGDKGTILYSENGGNTWLTKESGIVDYLTGIQFTGTLSAWAVGYGTVLRSGDSGKTWQSVNLGSSQNVYFDVHFIGSDTGWIVGLKGNQGAALYKTTDGGLIWQDQSSAPALMSSFSSPNAIHFINAKTGWIVGGRAGLFIVSSNRVSTRSGGTEWKADPTISEFPFRSIFFTDTEHGWMVGDGGMILSTIPGGDIPVQGPTSEESGFLLYPNPGEQSVFVTGIEPILEVLVYSDLGKVVEVPILVLAANKWQLDISGLAPCMYFIKITTGHTTVFKRLVKK